MAIYRPKAIGDAPEGLERSGGRCRRDFLASRGMGVSPGEESRVDSVAAQTIEAQPVFGQIEPSKRPRASRAEPQVREKMAILGLTWQEVETVRRRKRNEGRQKALSSVQSQLQTSGSSAVSVSTRTQSTPCHRSVPRKVATTFRSSSLACVPRAAVADKLDGQMAQDHCLCAAAVRTGLGSLPTAVSESSGRASVKMVSRVHAVPPIKSAPRQAKI